MAIWLEDVDDEGPEVWDLDDPAACSAEAATPRPNPSSMVAIPGTRLPPIARRSGEAYAGGPPMPSCAIIPAMSMTPQWAIALPSRNSMMSMTAMSNLLPVAGTPMNSPW